jgi:HSP20 family protein
MLVVWKTKISNHNGGYQMVTYYLAPRSFRRIRRYEPVGFNGGRRIPVDVHADQDGYVITADVPGLKAEDISIEILDDVVTLRSEVEHANGDGNGKYLLRELRHGGFTRSLQLPTNLDPNAAEAKVEDGVLTVRIPKSEDARPKEIKVKAK